MTDGRRGIGSMWSRTFQTRPLIRAQIQYGVGPDARPFYRLKMNVPGGFENQFHRELIKAKIKAEDLYREYLKRNRKTDRGDQDRQS
jgi:hypothetical protein